MHEVIMPKLGLTMETGKIEKWLKKEGDTINAGDVLFEVMTDKVSLEVESYNSGVLKKILKDEGEEVPVTEVVAYIGLEEENIPDKKSKEKNEKELKEETARSATVAKEYDYYDLKENSKPKDMRIKISPLARKMANDNTIDISKIKGSGPGGRIIKNDLLKFISSGKETNDLGNKSKKDGSIKIRSSEPLTGIRKIISERMSDSKKSIPHISLRIKVNVTDLVNLREQIKEKYLKIYDIKITYTDFILKSCALALSENIEINSSYIDDNYLIYEDINIGLAVAAGGGLVVPTIYGCNKLNLVSIAKKRNELVLKARDGKLTLDDISNGTFTITNLGMYGIRSSVPIINPPQAAIIAIGEIYPEPVMDEDKYSIRSFMEMTLSCDHRIINGDTAAIFLKNIKEKMENPLNMFI